MGFFLLHHWGIKGTRHFTFCINSDSSRRASYHLQGGVRGGRAEKQPVTNHLPYSLLPPAKTPKLTWGDGEIKCCLKKGVMLVQKSYYFCKYTLSPPERQGREIPRSLPRKFAGVGIGVGGMRVERR